MENDDFRQEGNKSGLKFSYDWDGTKSMAYDLDLNRGDALIMVVHRNDANTKSSFAVFGNGSALAACLHIALEKVGVGKLVAENVISTRVMVKEIAAACVGGALVHVAHAQTVGSVVIAALVAAVAGFVTSKLTIKIGGGNET